MLHTANTATSASLVLIFRGGYYIAPFFIFTLAVELIRGHCNDIFCDGGTFVLIFVLSYQDCSSACLSTLAIAQFWWSRDDKADAGNGLCFALLLCIMQVDDWLLEKDQTKWHQLEMNSSEPSKVQQILCAVSNCFARCVVILSWACIWSQIDRDCRCHDRMTTFKHRAFSFQWNQGNVRSSVCEVMREQLVGVTCVELSWHEFVLVKSTAELGAGMLHLREL